MTSKHLAITFICFSLVGCTTTAPTLIATPSANIGDPISVKAIGVPDGADYILETKTTDRFQRVWHSKPSPHAGLEPQVYDVNELISAMELVSEQPDDWQAPPPLDYNDIHYALKAHGTEIATATTRQWVVPRDIESVEVADDLVAELFYSTDSTGKRPGIVVLGGSGVGKGWASSTAALLANEGYIALAVAYFNAETLPSHLVEIPVEYIEHAIDVLKADARVESERIAMVGYSKGAELALLTSSMRDDISTVVAFAPGSAVFQGFRPPDFPVISSWSVDGVGLPFVPNAYDKHFFKTFDGMYLWYQTLAQHKEYERAAIPVEQIHADVLLISGVDDTIWPATFMAEQIIARLHVNEHSYRSKHLAFPEAGHGIAAPPGSPISSVAERFGGTVEGNAKARAVGWQAVIEFLAESLKSIPD